MSEIDSAFQQEDTDIIGDVLEWLGNFATDIIESLGYTGVALLIILENVFPPIPSEVVLPLAGFLAGQGRMWLPAVILSATLGAVAGAWILYGVGAWFGEERLRALITRFGKWLGVKESDLDKAEGWFDNHGGKAVLICRLVPIVRSLISIPAGLRRMPLLSFSLYTAIGSGLWNSILILGGWWLGSEWERVGEYTSYLEYPVLIAIAAFAAWWIWNRIIKREPEQGDEATSAE